VTDVGLIDGFDGSRVSEVERDDQSKITLDRGLIDEMSRIAKGEAKPTALDSRDVYRAGSLVDDLLRIKPGNVCKNGRPRRLALKSALEIEGPLRRAARDGDFVEFGDGEKILNRWIRILDEKTVSLSRLPDDIEVAI
jgi:hypothetical protein